MENFQGSTLKDMVERIEREEIIKALRKCGWVMAHAAKSLGITERIIGYKINKYGLRVKEVRWKEEIMEEQENGKVHKELN